MALKPLERARRIKAERDAGVPLAELAAHWSCTKVSIINAVALTTLEPEVQAAVDAGQVPVRYALRLARMERDEQLATFRKMVSTDATHGAHAERVLAAARGTTARIMRDRDFLERWLCVLKSRPDRTLDAAAVLAFALGEAPPNDATFLKTLDEAGWKPRRYERE